MLHTKEKKKEREREVESPNASPFIGETQLLVLRGQKINEFFLESGLPLPSAPKRLDEGVDNIPIILFLKTII